MLYLASNSPRRKEILTELGIKFIARPSHCQEYDLHSPKDTVLENSIAKLKATAKIIDNKKNDIISADTVVYCSGKILGKPRDKKDAYNMLATLSNKTHQVYTGVSVYLHSNDSITTAYEVTNILFKKLSSTIIKDYLNSIDYLDKAGSYAIQKNRDLIIENIDGSQSNVIGLPKGLTLKLLAGSHL